MDGVGDRESLVTDLIYLRKDRGLTTGRLSQASSVVEACGGRRESLGLLRLRLIAAIQALADESTRDALVAAYALTDETEDLQTTAERRKAYGTLVKRGYDTLADREIAAIEELASELLSPPYRTLREVPQESLADLRELYRYGQETLLYIEAFDVMAGIVSGLRRADAGAVYRRALANISIESHFTDLALWHFAHCWAALQRVLAVRSASNFLRAGLPNIWWNEKLDRPFRDYSRLALDALGMARDADDLGRRLRSSDGARLEERWRRLLAAEAPDAAEVTASQALSEDPFERQDLRVRLVLLCKFLARFFPDETRSVDEMSANYGVVVHDCLILVAEYASARSIPDDAGRTERGIQHAIVNPPNHYIFGGEDDCAL